MIIKILLSTQFLVINIGLAIAATTVSVMDKDYPDIFTFGVLTALLTLNLWGRLRR